MGGMGMLGGWTGRKRGRKGEVEGGETVIELGKLINKKNQHYCDSV